MSRMAVAGLQLVVGAALVGAVMCGGRWAVRWTGMARGWCCRVGVVRLRGQGCGFAALGGQCLGCCESVPAVWRTAFCGVCLGL